MRLYGDLETFSELDLKVVGTYRYAKSAEILLFAYAIDDGPVKVWDVTAQPYIPDDLAHALTHAEEVLFHNAMFDRAVIEQKLSLFAPPLSRWRCTMAQALSHALPAGLSDLCRVLRVPEEQAKLKEGRKLIHLFCKPQPKGRKIQRATRETHPEQWGRFIAYAANDIEAMRECHRRMPTWNWSESAIAEWHLDQTINDRGFFVDRDLTQAGARAAEREKLQLATRFVELTSGTVARPSLRGPFLDYLNNQFHLGLDNTRSGTFETLLKERKDLPADCVELMKISIASNKTSTAKYAALDPAVDDDGRFRGGLQFAGASRTRRWAGRLFQPQNLPSRGLPDPAEVEDYIKLLKNDVHDLFYTDLMRFGAAALRGVIIAPPGKKLCVADLSNIEGRMLAWFAGEEWKLKAFREYDAGTGPDLYNITAASILGGDPWKVAKKDRNVFGKVPDLACLAGDTQVLTQRGLVAIMEVLATDKLWDGVEWVSHDGLIAKGVRKVVSADGIEVTRDHLIATRGTWTQAGELVTCANTLSLALETGSASWSSLVSNEAAVAAFEKCSSPALAELLAESSKRTCEKAQRHAADTARSRRAWRLENAISGTNQCAPMNPIVVVCSTELPRPSIGAAIRTTRPSQTTEDEASAFIHRGSKTALNSSPTCSRWTAGTIRSSNWTESTWIKATSPETYALSRVAETAGTNDPFSSAKRESQSWKPVFDLLNAGPRNRFLVKSASGWLLVHNCGYQGGVAGFQTFAKAYGVKMADHWDTIQKAIDPRFIEKAQENSKKPWARAQLEEMGIPLEEWIASETCKLAWRARHPATERLWYDLQNAAKSAIRNWGAMYPVGRFLKVRCISHQGQRWMLVRLPSNRLLTYFNPAIEDDGSLSYWGDAAEQGSTTRRWVKCFTHGGKMTGNVCQTTARDILMSALPTAEARGYKAICSVHDELLTETLDTADYSAEGLASIMSTNPEWAPGLPLSAAGFEAYRYRKE